MTDIATLFARDPFVSLDVDGVGQLVQLAAERGRATRANIKLGIWLLLAGSVALLKRKPEMAKVSMLLLILLGGTAAWSVSNKPGEAPVVHNTPAPAADGSAATAPAAE